MSEAALKTTAFRLWRDNRERIDYAKRIGLNASELVNEILREHLRERIEKVRAGKLRELKEVLSEPLP